jgi:hypothetical protein
MYDTFFSLMNFWPYYWWHHEYCNNIHEHLHLKSIKEILGVQCKTTFSKKIQLFTHINQAIHILFSLILNPLLNAINIKFTIICVKVKMSKSIKEILGVQCKTTNVACLAETNNSFASKNQTFSYKITLSHS